MFAACLPSHESLPEEAFQASLLSLMMALQHGLMRQQHCRVHKSAWIHSVACSTSGLELTALKICVVCCFVFVHASRYVLCPGCKSVDTLLDKDSATRLMHLRCQQCGASRTVQAIKSGFVARVTKRQHTG